MPAIPQALGWILVSGLIVAGFGAAVAKADGLSSGDQAVPALIEELKNPDPQKREEAATALGRIGPVAAAAIEPLIATFADPDLYLRGAAAVALSRIGAGAVSALTDALADPNPEIRWSAAIALGRLGPHAASAVTALSRALNDPNEHVRYGAAAALGEIGPAAWAALPALTETLHDRDEDVRRGATGALQQIAPFGRNRPVPQAELIATIERLTPMLMSELKVPGVSIALIRGRELVWSKGFGVRDSSTKAPVSRETVFEAASMSKPIFALLVMQLVERGRLALDRPLGRDGDDPAFPKQPGRRLITPRLLLSHTAGFPNWRFGGEEREGPLPLLFQPGARFGYSGEGIFYLQRAVERITGRPLDRLAEEALFQPLRFKQTSFAWTPGIDAQLASGHRDDGTVLTRSKYTHPNAAYSLYTTAEEYARLLVEVLKAWRSDSPWLKARSVREMLRPQVALDSRAPIERPGPAQGRTVHWGLGWGLNTTALGIIAHHSGANQTGFRCFSQFSPTRGSGIVILTNGTQGGELWTRLVAAVGDL